MPSTSDGLRALIVRWFPNPESPYLANELMVEEFLGTKGYRFLPDGRWLLPTPAHQMSFDERLCLRYLVEEWDYAPAPDNFILDPFYPELIND